jgi:hypothetical protein
MRKFYKVLASQDRFEAVRTFWMVNARGWDSKFWVKPILDRTGAQSPTDMRASRVNIPEIEVVRSLDMESWKILSTTVGIGFSKI